MSPYTQLDGNRNAKYITLNRGLLRKEDLQRLSTDGTAFVESWGRGPTEEMVSTLRIAGIGAEAIGKKLKVKIVARDGQRVLDELSWRIENDQSPHLRLAAPLPSTSIGAVLIAVE